MYYCAADRFLLFSFYYNFSLPSLLFSPLSCTLLFLAINTAHTHTLTEREGEGESEKRGGSEWGGMRNCQRIDRNCSRVEEDWEGRKKKKKDLVIYY